MSEELNPLQHTEAPSSEEVHDGSESPTAKESSGLSLDVDQMSNADLEKMLSSLYREQNKRKKGKKKALQEIARLCEEHEIGKNELLTVLKQQ